MAGGQGGGIVSLQFAVVHEAPADFQTATELVDRVLVESIEWMEENLIDYHRTWFREWNGAPLTWKRVKQSALDAGIDAIGFFDGEPAQPDARAARRAILYLRHAIPDLAGVLLIRDQDDQPERRVGLDQARRQEEGRFPVVVGLAVVERESWVISGFDPQDDVEKSRLAAERQTLGFDPCVRSQELTACKADNAPRSPKRVLRALCGGDLDRERGCWRETPLATLRSRGAENGLAAFLDEVRKPLADLIGHVSRRSRGHDVVNFGPRLSSRCTSEGGRL
jgi:hypothetical protein